MIFSGTKNIITLFVMSAIILPTTACVPALLGGAGVAGYAGVQERTVGRAVDDATIDAEIQSSFVQKNVRDLFVNVGVEVNEGRVLLTGAVKDPETSVEAVRLAWQPKGVKEVINEIQVTDKTSLNDYAKDVWISAQVKSKLLFGKHIRSANYSIETVNGVVYLMGLAKDQDELSRAANVVSTVKGVKKVISHVRLYDDQRRQ